MKCLRVVAAKKQKAHPRVGFPEGRIVPGLCAEGLRTHFPRAEHRGAAGLESSK